MKIIYKAKDGKVFTDYCSCCEYEAGLIIKEKFKMYDSHGVLTNDYYEAVKIELLEDLTNEDIKVLPDAYDYAEDIVEKGTYIWNDAYEIWCKDGKLPKKKYEVECGATRYITVLAADEDEAEKIVQNMDFDDIFSDKEFETFDVEEV